MEELLHPQFHVDVIVYPCPNAMLVQLIFTIWINNYIHYKVWDEIIYPFLILNGATV